MTLRPLPAFDRDKSPRAYQPRHVLIVEDDIAVLEMLADALGGAGYSVMAVGHPEMVAAVARRRTPDLFLVDIMLADASGVEVAQQLRRAGFTDTPMIGMSASSLMNRVATEAGVFQAVLEKPFELNDLFAELERLLATSS